MLKVRFGQLHFNQFNFLTQHYVHSIVKFANICTHCVHPVGKHPNRFSRTIFCQKKREEKKREDSVALHSKNETYLETTKH